MWGNALPQGKKSSSRCDVCYFLFIKSEVVELIIKHYRSPVALLFPVAEKVIKNAIILLNF